MSRQFSRVWISILMLALLFSARLAAVSAQQRVECAADATVQPGDTLSLLAARLLGSAAAYPQIVAATNAKAAEDASYATITNASLLSVGWKLCIPTGGNATVLLPTASPTATATHGPSPTPTTTPVPLVTPPVA